MSKVFGQPLLDDMAQSQSLPMPLVKQAAREILEVIREGLIRDKVVKVSNFGTFRLKPVAARRGINPQTGESITIPARHRVLFTPCKALREMIQPIHRPPVPIDPERPRPDGGHDETTDATPPTAQSEDSQTEQTAVESVQQNYDRPSPAPQRDVSHSSTASQPAPSAETNLPPERETLAADRGIDIEITPVSERETEKVQRPIEPVMPKQSEEVSEPTSEQAEHWQDESNTRLLPGAATQSRPRSEQASTSTLVETRPEDENSNGKKYLLLGAAAIAVIALLSTGLLMDEAAVEKPSPGERIASKAEGVLPATKASTSEVKAEPPASDIKIEPAPADTRVAANETAQRATPAQGDSTEVTETPRDNAKSAATSRADAGESGADPGSSFSARSSEDFFSAQTHTIASGESLWRLARHHYRDPLLWPHIFQANTGVIENPDYLLVSRTITIPGLEGSPEELTRTDRRNIAKGYYLAYLYYKKSGREDALFALLEAKRYDKELVEERRGQMNLTRVEQLKLAQQAPMPF